MRSRAPGPPRGSTDRQLFSIARVRSRNATAWERIARGAGAPVDWGALGFTIQTLYGEDLDPTKTSEVQAVVGSIFAQFPERHERFVAQLRSIAVAP